MSSTLITTPTVTAPPSGKTQLPKTAVTVLEHPRPVEARPISNFEKLNDFVTLKPGYRRIQGINNIQNIAHGESMAPTSATRSIKEPVIASEVSVKSANILHQALSPPFIPSTNKQDE